LGKRLMMTGRYGLAALLAGLLTACVSLEYGPMGPDRPYGYKETKREDGSYVLLIQHPDGKKAYEFWDRRAAELCGSKIYEKNIFRAIRPTIAVPGYSATPGMPILEGYLTCGSAAPAATPAPATASPGQ